MTSDEPRRQIPDPGFRDDDGSADPALAAALTSYAGGGALVEVLGALQHSRLLVPVVAVLGETDVDEHGLTHDKTSDMAAVLLTGADGRMALLAFTSLEALAAWDPGARPVPVPATLAALSAVQEEAAALVVDVAGPATLVVEGEDLTALAAGWRLVRAGDRSGWIRPGTESSDILGC